METAVPLHMVQDGCGTLTIQSVFSAGDWIPTGMTFEVSQCDAKWQVTGISMDMSLTPDD